MSEDYFRRVHAADPANAKVQKLEEHLDWATGRRGQAAPRWAKLVDKVVSGLKPEVASPLRSRLQLLGNRAIGEWAKDNNVRAFDEKPFLRWTDALEKARAQDAGDSKIINDAIDQASRELDELIRGRGLPLL